MTLRNYLAENLLLRKVAIKTLSLFPVDIQIRNPWTNDELKLNLFRHKGYWFYRQDRENLTMNLFATHIKQGGTVVEVGGHIGFITQYFSRLVGERGGVYVFEPGSNNLRYLRTNTEKLRNVRIVEKAVSNSPGQLTFYEDDITGQNNSLLPDYGNLDAVARSHGLNAKRTPRAVDVTTLDMFLRDKSVDFLKMDIEGYELQALQGAVNVLSKINKLMVEVTENHEQVFDLLKSLGFSLHSERGELVNKESCRGNIFALR
jgi:FkbM family methyltransferase